MLRFASGAGSALLLVLAGFFVWKIQAQPEQAIPAPPPATERSGTGSDEGAAPSGTRRPNRPPQASEKSKEERRFDRADKNNDGRVTREEMLQPRMKAYQRLDTNKNSSLSFEEWAVRTATKFGEADSNRDGNLTRQEYATTAPRPRPQNKCNC